MKVRLQSADVGIRPREVDGLNVVVIFDDYDQPIMLALKSSSGVVWTRSAGDEDFNKVLNDLGLLKRKAEKTEMKNLPASLTPGAENERENVRARSGSPHQEG